MDSGDIIAQYSFPYNGQGIKQINDEIDYLVERYAGEVISDFINCKILPYKQDDSQATFGAKRNLEDCIIDFNMPNKYMRRFFAALNPPYPYPILVIRGKKYYVLDEYKIIDREYYGSIGRVVNKNDLGVWIKTIEGFLIVKNVREVGTDNEIELSELIPIGYRFN